MAQRKKQIESIQHFIPFYNTSERVTFIEQAVIKDASYGILPDNTDIHPVPGLNLTYKPLQYLAGITDEDFRVTIKNQDIIERIFQEFSIKKPEELKGREIFLAVNYSSSSAYVSYVTLGIQPRTKIESLEEKI